MLAKSLINRRGIAILKDLDDKYSFLFIKPPAFRDASLRYDRRSSFGRLLRRSQCDQHYTNNCVHNHSREFSAFDHIPVFLRCHYRSMRKIRPSAEGEPGMSFARRPRVALLVHLRFLVWARSYR